MTKCYECGNEFDKSELTLTVNGYVCDNCLDEYIQCQGCGDWVPDIEIYDVVSSISHKIYQWCEDCAYNHATPCNDCGRYFTGGLTYVSSHPIHRDSQLCDDCLEENNIYTCDECGYTGDDVYYDCDSGRYYCDDCSSRRCGSIRQYGKTNDLPFLGNNGELHMGVELEIDKGGENGNNADKIMAALGEGDYCECKHDGSLEDGFEVASAPATLKAHMETLDWETAMDKAINLGYRSHQPGTCGLHIHVDRDYFEDTCDDDYEDKFAMLFANNVEWIKKFSRRRDYGYCEVTEAASRKTTRKEAKDKKVNAKPNKCAKYSAINYTTGINTIEFRIFRGTLKYNTFVATLQFVQMFCDYVRDLDLELLADINEGSFLATARDKGYEEFICYMEERGISAAT